MNLEYVLRRRGKIENIPGYLCKAIADNYSSGLRKKKEEKAQHIKKATEAEREEEDKQAELREKKKRKDEVFNAYIDKLSPEELNNLYQEYVIPGNIKEDAKRSMLK